MTYSSSCNTKWVQIYRWPKYFWFNDYVIWTEAMLNESCVLCRCDASHGCAYTNDSGCVNIENSRMCKD